MEDIKAMKDITTYINKKATRTSGTSGTPVTLNQYNMFMMIKPGFLNKSKEILNIFEKHDYRVMKVYGKKLMRDQAKEFYEMHKNKPFFDDLIKYITSDHVIGYCLKYEGKGDVIEVTNKLKDEIRDTYGKDELKNAIHTSDSEKNVMRESMLFFNQI